MSATPSHETAGDKSDHSLHRLVRHPGVLVYVHIEYRRGEAVTMLRGPHPNGDLVEMAEFMSKCVDMIEDNEAKHEAKRQPNNTEAAEPRLSDTEKKWREFRETIDKPKDEDA